MCVSAWPPGRYRQLLRSVHRGAFCPQVIFAQHVLAPLAHTQQEMNQKFTPKADIYLAFRLQLVSKAMCICLIYGAALPACYLLTTALCWVSMWVDRYNLLRRLAPPPRSPDTLVATMTTVILPCAVAVHLCTTLVFYKHQLDVIRSDKPCGEGEDRSLSGRASECQTPHMLRHAEDAVRVCCVSLVLWGSFIVFFLWREAVRQVDRGLHLVGEATVAKFMDVLTVQENRVNLMPPSPGTFRRRAGQLALYTPPLPHRIIERLCLVSTARGHKRRLSTCSGRTFLTPPDDVDD